jgi:ATP-dependent exoDNAse (exonuclease V) beta subunit
MTDAPTAPPDSAARRRAIEAAGSVLVQAPAGSGKTTLLAQRYLKLLASVDAPERILALTFTRRAAQEMRERVVRAFSAAALADCPQNFNRQTWALAVAAKRHLDALQIDIERHPSRLRIETIDAFNAWLAGQLPVTAEAGARLNLIENARPLYEEAARHALAHVEPDSFAAAVDRVLVLGDQRWRPLVDLIADMLPSRDRWLPLLAGRLQAASALDEMQLERVRRHFDEDLQLLVTRTLGAAYDALGGERIAALSPILRAAARRIEVPPPQIAEWRLDHPPLQPEPGQIERWRGLAAMCLTKDSALRKRLTKTEGFPPKCAEKPLMMQLLSEFERRPQALRALKELRALPNPEYSDEDWARVRDVAEVLVLAAAELERLFREQGAVDFPAVSMAALRALGSADAPTDLNLRLDYRLQHLLVDEFQDTSSAQLELVRLLTAGWQREDGRSVFCVGDPMQSIYGFRQAEVRAFLELAEDGIGDLQFDVQRLSSNFRSAAPLVDWINRCFGAIMPRLDDRDRGAIAFRPSGSMLPPAAGEEPEVAIRGFASRGAEALAIVELIEARRRQHPGWRIAVLVRAKAHAREIAHRLRMRGIEFHAVDIEPLQDRPVVRDLVMLISALMHLGDRIAWLAVLRAPWAGLRLADLLIVARAEANIWDAVCNDAVLKELSEDGRARCLKLRGQLEAAFRVRRHGTIARWVERAWLGLGGPSCAGDERELKHVNAVFARLRELEERGLPDAADLVASFADLNADGGGSSAVEIMTIHKAKGLEFDMVILPALDRHSRPNRGQLLLTHQFARTGRDGMVMAARPQVGADKNRLFEFLRRQTRDAADLEAERLLYVACTRAKWQLHLTATMDVREDPDDVAGAVIDETTDDTADDTSDDSTEAARTADTTTSWRKPRAGSLLAVLWPILEPEFGIGMASPTAKEAAAAQQETALRGGLLQRLPLGWSPIERGSSPPAADPASLGPLREETPVFDWAGETARRVGSLVHAELQIMDLEQCDEAAIRARAAHFSRWLALKGVPKERLHDAVARVTAALIGVHRDARGRWILKKGYRDDVREHAVSGYYGGVVTRVIFDRSFIDENGVRWIIDYKTSQHAGGGLEEFLQREVERYRPQLHRYAMLAKKLGPEPVRVGLYFPLMGAWREWAPES